jgi:Glycosyl transferase family 2
MRLALTLLAKNEADVIDANVAYHLAAGVDFVIATDNASTDGTTEILESYERRGVLHLIHEQGQDMRQGEWVTRMARLAATEFDADWVVHGDADEFYYPRGANLKEVFEPIPSRFGTVRTFVRTFLLRPDDDELFAERMTVRLATLAPINDPASIFRPGAKIVHRADPNIELGDGTHSFRGVTFAHLRGWHPIELLHFPFRTREQTERKFLNAWSTWSRNPNRPPPHYYAKATSAIQEERLPEFLDSLTIDDAKLARGLEDRSLVLDTRLRDVLRRLRQGEAPRLDSVGDGAELELPPPDLLEQTRYAVDAAVLDEADVARLQRRMDELEMRLGAVEQAPWRGLTRRLAGRRTRG